MDDLIEALTILSKYMRDGVGWPTHCEHDVLYVCHVNPKKVSAEDLKRLKALGFRPSGEVEQAFESSRFGSC